MNEHLSAEEISRWMVGDGPAHRESHVRGCAACGGEIARLESALHEFRGAVHSAGVPAPDLTAKRRAHRALPWVLTAAAALMLRVSVPFYRHRQAAETARADAILLDQVDAEVSQAVPRPMEPLVQLVSWSSSSEGNGETQ